MEHYANEGQLVYAAIRSGNECAGDDCYGWILHPMDVWVQCPCNAQKGNPHPWDEEYQWELERQLEEEAASGVAVRRVIVVEDVATGWDDDLPF